MKLATCVGGVDVVVAIEHPRVARALARVLDPATNGARPTHLVRPDPDFGPALGHVWRIGLDGPFDPRGYWNGGEAAAALWESIEHHVVMRARQPLLHAAAVETAGTAILLVAATRGGKSTLVATIAAAGLGRSLSDELVAVAGPDTVTALTRPLHMRPESQVSAPSGWERWPSGRHDLFVPPRPPSPGPWSAAAVIFLDRLDTVSGSIGTRLSAAAAARRLMGSSQNVVALGWDGLARLATFAGNVPAWSLRYREATAASAALGPLAAERDRPFTVRVPGAWRQVAGRSARCWSFGGSTLVVGGDRRWAVAIEDPATSLAGDDGVSEQPMIISDSVAEQITSLIGGSSW